MLHQKSVEAIEKFPQFGETWGGGTTNFDKTGCTTSQHRQQGKKLPQCNQWRYLHVFWQYYTQSYKWIHENPLQHASDFHHWVFLSVLLTTPMLCTHQGDDTKFHPSFPSAKFVIMKWRRKIHVSIWIHALLNHVQFICIDATLVHHERITFSQAGLTKQRSEVLQKLLHTCKCTTKTFLHQTWMNHSPGDVPFFPGKWVHQTGQ